MSTAKADSIFPASCWSLVIESTSDLRQDGTTTLMALRTNPSKPSYPGIGCNKSCSSMDWLLFSHVLSALPTPDAIDSVSVVSIHHFWKSLPICPSEISILDFMMGFKGSASAAVSVSLALCSFFLLLASSFSSLSSFSSWSSCSSSRSLFCCSSRSRFSFFCLLLSFLLSSSSCSSFFGCSLSLLPIGTGGGAWSSQ